ncbi:MAG: adenylate/guanylate cyclase domain-containing protein [Planctomycetaceae bacterium]|nr:adenylate/guanylate cyclase domain-containing protein [Planctomycetaceae bacterium]
MPDLVAQAEDGRGRWRRPLQRGTSVLLGRQQCQWSVPWDSQISRRHAEVHWNGEILRVTRLPSARNPIFYKGQAVEQCEVGAGQHFVIGRTTFTLTGSQVDATLQLPDPTREQLFSRQKLAEVRFRDAERRLAIVTELPAMIQDAATDQELFIRVLNVVFGGISQAASAAVVAVGSGSGGTGVAPHPASEVRVLHWDRRSNQDADFQPSQRLITSSVQKQQTVLHVWEGTESQIALTQMHKDHDWAFVTPLPPVGNQTLVLYVSGALQAQHHSDSPDSVAGSLQEDIKYAELVANILGSLLSLRHLQHRQASLRSFFSPVVLDALQDTTPEELFQPRECEVSILFCDLRGFSAASQRMAHDLMQLLQRVSEALGVTTSHIMRQRGVVGDFHGDATMGFWGWPLPQADRVRRACQAAIDIHRQFREMSADPDNPLHGFQLGLGIASGIAVAGQIGTQDQVKVTAFGPVVNLAARLETMNRQLGTSILMEQETVNALQRELELDRQPLPFRIRSLGKVLPVGLLQPIEVCEVLPEFPTSPLTDEDLKVFAAGLAHFQSGHWELAYDQLHRVPAADRAKDLLTMLITQHNRQAPFGWDGIIRLQQK